MTAEEFNDWIRATGISGREAARRLEIGKNTVVEYRRKGAPRAIGLACAALWAGLDEWRGSDVRTVHPESDMVGAVRDAQPYRGRG